MSVILLSNPYSNYRVKGETPLDYASNELDGPWSSALDQQRLPPPGKCCCFSGEPNCEICD